MSSNKLYFKVVNNERKFKKYFCVFYLFDIKEAKWKELGRAHKPKQRKNI